MRGYKCRRVHLGPCGRSSDHSHVIELATTALGNRIRNKNKNKALSSRKARACFKGGICHGLHVQI